MENTQILDKVINISKDSPKAPLLDKLGALRDEKEKSDFSAVKMTNSLFALLDSRESQILKLRYGFGVDKAETLGGVS